MNPARVMLDHGKMIGKRYRIEIDFDKQNTCLEDETSSELIRPSQEPVPHPE